MADLFGQGAHQVRFDWGPVGALAVEADVVAVVDVLSFSACITVAVERGIEVYPYRWRDASAEAYAERLDAVLARGRSHTQPSLSPAALLSCDPVPRLVLPSPNGSTICTLLDERGCSVGIGGVRNARAAGEWLAAAVRAGRTVAVIAAGERWESDDSLRPALE
ncbi:MAG TPA: 2-phosphosulfolactate phosphatase, partial [Nocardioides sp.]|nr:2-phosphosulfolactate phosphatase [Nocardioides sp.]